MIGGLGWARGRAVRAFGRTTSVTSPPALPPASEFYGDLNGASYYSVAVVPKEFCTDKSSFKDLKVRAAPAGVTCMQGMPA